MPEKDIRNNNDDVRNNNNEATNNQNSVAANENFQIRPNMAWTDKQIEKIVKEACAHVENFAAGDGWKELTERRSKRLKTILGDNVEDWVNGLWLTQREGILERKTFDSWDKMLDDEQRRQRFEESGLFKQFEKFKLTALEIQEHFANRVREICGTQQRRLSPELVEKIKRLACESVEVCGCASLLEPQQIQKIKSLAKESVAEYASQPDLASLDKLIEEIKTIPRQSVDNCKSEWEATLACSVREVARRSAELCESKWRAALVEKIYPVLYDSIKSCANNFNLTLTVKQIEQLERNTCKSVRPYWKQIQPALNSKVIKRVEKSACESVRSYLGRIQSSWNSKLIENIKKSAWENVETSTREIKTKIQKEQLDKIKKIACNIVVLYTRSVQLDFLEGEELEITRGIVDSYANKFQLGWTNKQKDEILSIATKILNVDADEDLKKLSAKLRQTLERVGVAGDAPRCKWTDNLIEDSVEEGFTAWLPNCKLLLTENQKEEIKRITKESLFEFSNVFQREERIASITTKLTTDAVMALVESVKRYAKERQMKLTPRLKNKYKFWLTLLAGVPAQEAQARFSEVWEQNVGGDVKISPLWDCASDFAKADAETILGKWNAALMRHYDTAMERETEVNRKKEARDISVCQVADCVFGGRGFTGLGNLGGSLFYDLALLLALKSGGRNAREVYDGYCARIANIDDARQLFDTEKIARKYQGDAALTIYLIGNDRYSRNKGDNNEVVDADAVDNYGVVDNIDLDNRGKNNCSAGTLPATVSQNVDVALRDLRKVVLGSKQPRAYNANRRRLVYACYLGDIQEDEVNRIKRKARLNTTTETELEDLTKATGLSVREVVQQCPWVIKPQHRGQVWQSGYDDVAELFKGVQLEVVRAFVEGYKTVFGESWKTYLKKAVLEGQAPILCKIGETLNDLENTPLQELATEGKGNPLQNAYAKLSQYAEEARGAGITTEAAKEKTDNEKQTLEKMIAESEERLREAAREERLHRINNEYKKGRLRQEIDVLKENLDRCSRNKQTYIERNKTNKVTMDWAIFASHELQRARARIQTVATGIERCAQNKRREKNAQIDQEVVEAKLKGAKITTAEVQTRKAKARAQIDQETASVRARIAAKETSAALEEIWKEWENLVWKTRLSNYWRREFRELCGNNADAMDNIAASIDAWLACVRRIDRTTGKYKAQNKA